MLKLVGLSLHHQCWWSRCTAVKELCNFIASVDLRVHAFRLTRGFLVQATIVLYSGFFAFEVKTVISQRLGFASLNMKHWKRWTSRSVPTIYCICWMSLIRWRVPVNRVWTRTRCWIYMFGDWELQLCCCWNQDDARPFSGGAAVCLILLSVATASQHQWRLYDLLFVISRASMATTIVWTWRQTLCPPKAISNFQNIWTFGVKLFGGICLAKRYYVSYVILRVFESSWDSLICDVLSVLM